MYEKVKTENGYYITDCGCIFEKKIKNFHGYYKYEGVLPFTVCGGNFTLYVTHSFMHSEKKESHCQWFSIKKSDFDGIWDLKFTIFEQKLLALQNGTSTDYFMKCSNEDFSVEIELKPYLYVSPDTNYSNYNKNKDAWAMTHPILGGGCSSK